MTTPAASTARLDAALNLIPLDASDRLGQALHAAGCPLDEWLAWCEFRAATKDDDVRLAAECRTAWAQFSQAQAGHNPNAVFDLAEEFGWIPYRDYVSNGRNPRPVGRDDYPDLERILAPTAFKPQRIPQQPFPVHCLPDLMQDAVAAASIITSRPAAPCAAVALTCAAAVFQAEYRYTTDRWGVQVISLYTIISAPPGQGKSEISRLFMPPFRGTDATLSAAYAAAQQKWDDMEPADRRRNRSENPKRIQPDILCSDATIEALARQLTHGRAAMLQVMTEGSTLVGGWSGSADNVMATLGRYNTLWEGESIDVLRMRDGGTYKTPPGRTLSKIIMGQRQVLDWALDPRAAFGYSARILLTKDDAPDEVCDGNTDHDQAHQDIKRFNDVLRAALRRQNADIELANTPPWPLIGISPDPIADAYFQESLANDRALTGPDLADDEADLVAQWQRRRTQIASRITAVCAAFNAASAGYNGPMTIDRHAAQQGMEIADWFHGELGRCIAASGYTEETADAQKAWETINSKLGDRGQGNVRETLRKKAPFIKDTARLERAIKWLETASAIQRIPEKRAQWNLLWE